MKTLTYILLAWYGTLSLITWAVYALDKSAAIRQERRTPERTLHLLALCGGWPGAWLAQQWLRHKSSKTRFLLVFWVCVVVNLVITAALVSWAIS